MSRRAIRIEIVNGYVDHVWCGDVDIRDYVTKIDAEFLPRPRQQFASVKILADVEWLVRSEDVSETGHSGSGTDSSPH